MMQHTISTVAEQVFDVLYKAFPALPVSDAFIRRWCRDTAAKVVAELELTGE
jgi:hypothetical protein